MLIEEFSHNALRLDHGRWNGAFTGGGGTVTHNHNIHFKTAIVYLVLTVLITYLIHLLGKITARV